MRRRLEDVVRAEEGRALLSAGSSAKVSQSL